jgi:hypothetical protein
MDLIAGANELTHLFYDMLSSPLTPIISYTPENNLFSQALFISSV